MDSAGTSFGSSLRVHELPLSVLVESQEDMHFEPSASTRRILPHTPQQSPHPRLEGKPLHGEDESDNVKVEIEELLSFCLVYFDECEEEKRVAGSFKSSAPRVRVISWFLNVLQWERRLEEKRRGEE